MDYYKKVVVLKEVEQGYSCGDKPINAIARLEVESDIADLYVSVINITGAVTGEYTLFLYDQSTLYHFDLGKRPLSFRFPFSKTPNLSNGFCVGIFYVENYIPVLVAFAKTENCQTDRIVFKKKVADKCLTRLKESQRQEIEELSKQLEKLTTSLKALLERVTP